MKKENYLDRQERYTAFYKDFYKQPLSKGLPPNENRRGFTIIGNVPGIISADTGLCEVIYVMPENKYVRKDFEEKDIKLILRLIKIHKLNFKFTSFDCLPCIEII